jgi:RNA polymerase sigma-70 factor, ECF subfamily
MFLTPASLLYRLRSPEDSRAWNRFVDLYSPLLYHWAKKLGYQDSDASDLVQDVFVTLWQKMPEFEYDSGRSFHAWLKTIFLNRFRSLVRKKVPLSMQSGSGVSDTSTETELDDAEDIQFLMRRAYVIIESEFSELHRKVFQSYVLEQLAPEKVAQATGISVGTVYSIKSKILSRLKQELKQIID